MIYLNNKGAILNLIILHVIGIIVNISIVFEGIRTYFNFIFSIFYLLAWVGYGIYFYIKKELTIYIYMFGYWIMVMSVSIANLSIILLNAQVELGTSKFSIISILLHIAVLTPLYGLKVFFKLPVKEELYSVILISMIFVILSILAILAINITRNDKKL